MGSVIEEINDVSAEAVFEAAALFEIEGAGRIDFDVAGFLEQGGEDALEEKRSAANLLHGEGDGMVGHGNEYKADANGRSGQRCKVGCWRVTQLFTMEGSVRGRRGMKGWARELSGER